jgi:hypothetical protein
MRDQQLGQTVGTSVTALGAMDAQFPITNIVDGFPSKPARWAANAGGEGFTYDARLLLNGDFETAFAGGVPGTGWTAQAGVTATRETGAGLFHGGAAALRVSGAGGGAVYYDITCSPGDRLQIIGWARKVAAGNNDAQIQIQNLSTLSWLTAGGAWQVAGASIISIAGTTYTSVTLAFTVESFAACQQTDVVLRVYFMTGGGGGTATDALYDDVAVVPGVDVVGVFGAGVTLTVPTNAIGNAMSWPAGLPIDIRTSPDNSVFSLLTSLTPKSPSFYKVFTLTYANYWKLSWATAIPIPARTTSVFAFLGEVVFGQTISLSRGINSAVKVSASEPHLDAATRTGEVRSTLLTTAPRHELEVQFTYTSQADYEEARDQIWRLSRHGAYPFVFIHDDQDADIVSHGAPAEDTFAFTAQMRTWREGDTWRWIGSPMPQFITQ